MTISRFGFQGGDPDHLNLITLHSAKGLEFDVVMLPGMDQGRLPRWDAKTVTAKREARRLFYVGLTRARHEAHLLFSGWVTDRYGNRRINGPSEFLLEVQSRLQES